MLLPSVAEVCPALCNPMDCSLPGSSVRGESPGKNTEWVAMPSSSGSSQGIKPRSPALQVESLSSEPLCISAVCHLQLPMQKLILAIYTPGALGEKIGFIQWKLPVTLHPLVCFGVLISYQSSCPTLSVSFSLLIMKGFRGGRSMLIILIVLI